jgi:large subunit ribosomal protein L10
MSKPVKNLVMAELVKRYAGVDSACVVELTGINGVATHKLRGSLRSKGIELHVIKNRLAKRALAETKLSPVREALEGPCALATGGSSIVDVAKELVRLRKDFPTLALKKTVVEGDTSLVDVELVAKWKGKLETQGEVAMLAASPGRRLAGCIVSPGGKIAGCVKAIVEKLEKAEAPVEPPTETPAAA